MKMGAWGYEEHENDTFLDYIEDDTSVDNLMYKLNRRNLARFNPELVVGIINVMPAESRKDVDKDLIQRAREYLMIEKDIEESENSTEWRNKNGRLDAIDKQLRMLGSLLEDQPSR